MDEERRQAPLVHAPKNSPLAVRELKLLVFAVVPFLILILAYLVFSDSALGWLVTHLDVGLHFIDMIMAVIGIIAFIRFGDVRHGRKS